MNSDKPILELIENFLSNQDVHETSRKKYKANIHLFIEWLTRNCNDVKNPLRSDIIRYKQYLIDTNKSATTIDAYLVPLRQFFKYLESEHIYDDITIGLHSPRKYLGYRKNYLQSDQVSLLLSSIDRSIITGKRDFAIINLMCNTGLRCIEVSRMDVLDVRPSKAGYTMLIQGKGRINKDRAIHIPDALFIPIHDYLIERTDAMKGNPPMFVNHAYCSHETRFTQLSISKIIKRYMRCVDIDSVKLTAHSLRHTAAINAIKAGATISEVQSMLGHRNSDTTDIYLRALEAESAEEGTAIRLLTDFYKNNKKNDKS